MYRNTQHLRKCRLCVQVLERANKSEYGLAAGVFSNNVDYINSLSRCVSCMHSVNIFMSIFGLAVYVSPPLSLTDYLVELGTASQSLRHTCCTLT